MDDISQKRESLLAAYPGDHWASRVKTMTEGQVVAVYLRLKNRNKQ